MQKIGKNGAYHNARVSVSLLTACGAREGPPGTSLSFGGSPSVIPGVPVEEEGDGGGGGEDEEDEGEEEGCGGPAYPGWTIVILEERLNVMK